MNVVEVDDAQQEVPARNDPGHLHVALVVNDTQDPIRNLEFIDLGTDGNAPTPAVRRGAPSDARARHRSLRS